MSITGGCYCGGLRYEVTGDPVAKVQCHCRECQYFSGGAPNYLMLVPVSEFTYSKGTPGQFTRSDLENAVTREFCPDCGTHILTRLPGRDVVALKVGSLDEPARNYEGSQVAIFTMDKQPFHMIPEGLPQFERTAPRR